MIHLFVESVSLVDGVSQLGEGVRMLATDLGGRGREKREGRGREK